MIITSPSNERIKSMRRLLDKKSRQETGLFFLEGLHIIGEAFTEGEQIELLVACDELLTSEYGRDLVRKAEQAQCEVLHVSADVFRRLSLKEGPQGLAAVARQRWIAMADVRLDPGRPWVALDSVADPGNLGTILRTNDGAGGAGVILLDQSTDPYDPVAVRASMGAIFSQKVCRASLDEFSSWRKASAAWVIGTSDAAQSDYHSVDYPDEFVLLMGSERHGLTSQHFALCDQVVSIPMLGKSDSLNLAVATAVILYETLNQRRDRSKGR